MKLALFYLSLCILKIYHCCMNRDPSSSINDMTPEEKRDLQKREEALHASSLRVPRRQFFL